jgi:hypothetical protein
MSASMTRSWPNVKNFYQELASLALAEKLAIGGMLNLVGAVIRSRYIGALHAWTSMQALCIVQVPAAYPYDGPHLVITPLANGKLDFRYVDTPKPDQQWHRVADEQDGFKTLEKFFLTSCIGSRMKRFLGTNQPILNNSHTYCVRTQ